MRKPTANNIDIKHSYLILFLVSFSLILLILIFTGCSAFRFNSVYADSTTRTKLYLNQVLDISAPSTAILNCTPGTTDSNANLCTTDIAVVVNTNNDTGYTLYMNTTSGYSTSLTNTAISPSATVSTLSNPHPLSSPTTFPINTWGYTGGSDQSSVTGGYDCTNGGGSSGGGNYCPILAYIDSSGSSSYAPNHTINTTNAPAASSTTNLTFAARVNTDKPSGTYTSSITFTAVANAVPVQPITNGMSMQDVTSDVCNATQTYEQSNTIYTLRDDRDGTEYTVAKLADNNCWMTQNLELGEYGKPITLTAEDSNVSPNGYTLTLPYANNSVYKGNSNHYGNYYGWNTATAGSGTSTSGENAPYDICPKGWRLPKAGSSATEGNEFYAMLSPYITTGTWVEATENSSARWTNVDTSQFTNTPVFLIFSGLILSSGTLSSQGSLGDWETSTSASSSHAFRLRTTTYGGVMPRSSEYKDAGFTVRCLVPSS